jgi:hypothetical protein
MDQEPACIDAPVEPKPPRATLDWAVDEPVPDKAWMPPPLLVRPLHCWGWLGFVCEQFCDRLLNAAVRATTAPAPKTA